MAARIKAISHWHLAFGLLKEQWHETIAVGRPAKFHQLYSRDYLANLAVKKLARLRVAGYHV